MSVLNEIDRLIEAIASKLPASMENKDNQKLEKQLKSSMTNYFNSLSDAFPYQRLEALYAKNVKEVSTPTKPPASGEWDDWIENLLITLNAELSKSLVQQLANIYITGSTQMMSYGKTKLGIPILYEGPPISQAVNWASQYSAQLVTKINDETKSRLAQVISDGINNKRGIDGISRDIRKEFSDMSKSRADLISQTESNKALSEGSFSRMKSMGIDGKQSIAIGDERLCEVCGGNADQGVIPIDQPFQNGDMTPPFHPACRCALAPARLDRED